MRHHPTTPISLLALAWIVCLLSSGCGTNADDCTLTGTCGGSSATGGSGGSGAAPGGGGTGGSTPTECIPAEASGAVDDSCGLFVSSSLGLDTHPGTKSEPLATVAAALEVAGTGRIYLCTDGFDEAVSVSAPAELYGGLDCTAGWTYVGATDKTPLTAPAGSIVLHVAPNADGSLLTDLALTARDGSADSGESSIAALVDTASVHFERCELSAGQGAAGPDGATPSGGDLAGDDGHIGNSGTCAASVIGGDGGQKLCGGTDVAGGPGGNGINGSSGGEGGDGLPVDAVTGQGGLGQSGSSCDTGTGGADGLPGTPGAGAAGSGELSASGYLGAAGQDGQSPGSPGQGGGGGGGANNNQCPSLYSGGGGGSGGCGGLPGAGGAAGGASIALGSLDATVTLHDCSLSAAAGGAGGAGSPGQAGGNGGAQGNQGGPGACPGGLGGQGGRGGAAGGGAGGHSLAIAFVGTEPEATDTTLDHAAAGGAGGLGGDGGPQNQGGAGPDGLAAPSAALD